MTVGETWPITMREELDAGHDYDLIILSVNHDQLDSAVTFLSTRVGRATVLVFNNVWTEPADAVSGLPGDQVVWGFPGAGGGVSGSALRGGLLKPVFMGFCGDSNRTDRYRQVRDLFRRSGFRVSEQRDFRSWLWFHFIMDAGLLAQAIKAGSFSRMAASRTAAKESVLLIREMVPLLKAKGGTPRLGAAAFSYIPAGLLGFLLRKFLGAETIYGSIMAQAEETGHLGPEAMSLYTKDVLAEARRLGVALPRMTALEPLFA
ncbi:ketopantoate reductase [Streptomyces sp. NRRL F-5126]|uniref:ketopantoate reductase n=1 Tax=Streptomyces sp. NRRL F-5126 TaxID=1463857 RepID=UPI000AF37412|nr:ketopantoate reductase [Streptomyces sp. NRRL F-5126]